MNAIDSGGPRDPHRPIYHYRSDDLLDWEYLHPLCTGTQMAVDEDR